MQELRYLSELTGLKVLNLAENPMCDELPYYRLMVLKHLPQLEKLDDIAVSFEELESARDMDIKNALSEGASGEKKTYV